MRALRWPLPVEAKIWILGGLLAMASGAVYWTLVRHLALEPPPVDVPWGLVAAGLLGSTLAMLLDREIPSFKAFFNSAQFMLGTCAALLALDAFGIGRDPLDPAVWVAVFGAVSASTLVSDVCVGVAVSLAEGGVHRRQRVDMMLGNWTVALSNTCLGLAAAAVVAAQPVAGLLLVPPTTVLLLAYRAYMGERRRSAELGFLYEATRTLSRSSEIQPELEALLERTAEAFRVSAVELVLFSAEPNRSARSSLACDGGRRMLEPLDEALADRLRRLAGGLFGPLDVGRTQELERKALYDSLTQLANRSLFHNRLEQVLEKGRPGASVLLLDIDEFKAVNDSHGHHAGDQLLRVVADRLRSCVREGDTAARLGGDEFALLLDRTGGEDDAVAVADQLLRDFETRVEVAGERLSVHISLGIAVGVPGSDDPDELLRRADVALYE